MVLVPEPVQHSNVGWYLSGKVFCLVCGRCCVACDCVRRLNKWSIQVQESHAVKETLDDTGTGCSYDAEQLPPTDNTSAPHEENLELHSEACPTNNIRSESMQVHTIEDDVPTAASYVCGNCFK